MLSILIPTYNYNVLPLVQELHKQASKAEIAFEIIVLDDASKNILPSSTETSANFIFIKNEINLGRTRTRAILAEKAKYNTLLFLDADVILETSHTAELVQKVATLLRRNKLIVQAGYLRGLRQSGS